MSGIAGSGSQSFSYDALSRLTGSSGLAGVARTYGYDLDSNRVAFTLGSDAYAVTFDRTDEAIARGKNGGAAVSFLYDRWGNVLSDAAAGTTAGIVTYGYDLADRTTSITRAGSTTTLVLDAAGRPRTRTTGSSVDTLTYLGASNEVVRVANTGGSGTTTDAVLDAAGTRLGTRSGSTVAWLTPDLHGSIAAGLPLAASSVTDALRYDGYGVTLAAWPTGGSEATAHWKYQGRLDLAPGAPDAGIPSLYDFGFREYAPALGAFTSLDDLVGSAQDPAALNRFLYAAANPATLIDPDGHCGTRICNIDGGGASQADAAIAYTRLAETNARAASRSLPRARDFSRSGDRGERAWSGGSDPDYAREVRAASIAKQVAAGTALAYAGLAGMATATYEARVEIVRHEATALEVLAMPVAVLGGGFVAAAGGAALTSGAMSVVRAGAGFVADVWAGWTTAGAAGACVMGLCPAGIAVGNTIESAVTGGGTPSSVAARAGAAVRGASGATPAGLGGLSEAGNYGIWPYKTLKADLKGTGLESHHLVEQRFAAIWGQKPSGMASIAVTDAEHQAFTNAWRARIPYGGGTAGATVAQVRAAATEIYAGYLDILRSLGLP